MSESGTKDCICNSGYGMNLSCPVHGAKQGTYMTTSPMTDTPETAPLTMSRQLQTTPKSVEEYERAYVKELKDEIDALRAALTAMRAERDAQLGVNTAALAEIATLGQVNQTLGDEINTLTARVAALEGALRDVRADLVPAGWDVLGEPQPFYGLTALGARALVEKIDAALAGEAP